MSSAEAARVIASAAATEGVELRMAPLRKDQHATSIFGHDGPEVWLEWIESHRKGAGAEAMRRMVAEADRIGAVIRADLDDDGSGKLASYYAGFGFQLDPAGGSGIERAPFPFTAWFGNSKMVDAFGQPRVLYHATGREFDVFRPGSNGLIFFARDMEYIEAARRDCHRIISVFLRVERPFTGSEDDLNAVLQANPENAARIHRDLVQYGSWTEFEAQSEAIQRAGFDSIYLEEAVLDEVFSNVAVFDPGQIHIVDVRNGLEDDDACRMRP